LAITTSSDVYVLGVLLYKLLCGASPFVISSVRLAEIERAICGKDPLPPSQAVSVGDSKESRSIADARGVSSARLRRTLRGDLDNIVAMAMRKEPERRYGSAQQMAGDIQRYLDGKPVIARRDTLSYRTTKFVKRHWLPVSAAAGVACLVVAFAMVTYLQTLRIAAERDRVAEQRELADRERVRAEEVSSFLINLFKLSDPEENRGNQVTARELLDVAAKRLRGALSDQPATKAALLETVGAVYDSLGQYQEALPILNESLALQPPGDEKPRIQALLELGHARFGAGDLQSAEAPLQEALRLAQNKSGAGSLDVARALWELGRLRQRQGQLAEAKNLYERGLVIFERAPGSPIDISAVLDDLAQVYLWEQNWRVAQQTYERALEIDRRVLGDDHPRVAMHLVNLALTAQSLGDLKKADELYREAIFSEERIYGQRSPQTAAAKVNYGSLLQLEGRLEEAEAQLRSALDIRLSHYGPSHYLVGYTRVSLGILLHEAGDLAGAEAEFRQALAVYDKTLSPTHQYRASLLMHLAWLEVDRGKPAEGLGWSEQSLQIWGATAKSAIASVASAHAIHAYALEHLGRSREAAEELDAAIPVLTKTWGPNDPVVQRVLAWQKTAHAEPLQTASTAKAH
jgi:tetratricopeptide (TPR) repeat protein